MACDEIIYNGNKYSEEEFVEMMNSGEVPVDGEFMETKSLTDDMQKEEVYLADENLDFNEIRAAYKAEKERVLALGAEIKTDNGKKLSYILPEKDTMFQAEGEIKSSKASDATVKQWIDWFKNTGTTLEKVTGNLTDAKGNKIDANESVDVLNRVVRVITGHENTAIPEAGMHIVARIIKERYPQIWKEMMKSADKFAIFPEVVASYKGFKAYQLLDGKPNMAKMKEETIGKLLAEYHILDAEGVTEKPELTKQVQTWWQKIVDYLKDFFKGNPLGTNRQERETATEQDYKAIVEKFNKGELRPADLTPEQRINQLKYKKHGLQNIIRGEGSVSGGGNIKAVTSYLSGGPGADRKDTTSREPSTREQRKVEREELKRYIEDNNLWYEKPFGKLLSDKTTEAEVYLDDDGKTVTKTNNLQWYQTWKDYLNNLLVHNYLFPDTAYTLKGFIKNGDLLKAVVEQPFVKGDFYPGKDRPDPELVEFLNANGFYHDPTPEYRNDSFNFKNPVLGIKVWDLHQGNVIKTSDGLPAFIDTQVFIDKEFFEDSDIKGESFYQATEPDKGKEVFDRLKKPIGLRKTTDEEGNSIYLKDNGLGKEVQPENRVTDYAKKVYEKVFGKKGTQGRDTIQEKTDRETGTRLHGYLEDIGARSIDAETGLRKPLDSKRGTIAPNEEHIYDSLEDYFQKVLDRYPEGTRFVQEQMIYKPGKKEGVGDIAGTMDFVAVKPDGTIANLDWKFMNDKQSRSVVNDLSNVTQKAHNVQLSWYNTILRTAYGVKTIDQSNSVPFKLIYGKDTDKYTLKNVVIGDSDYTAINDRTMLPVVGSNVDIPGDAKTTAFINRLNKLYERTYNETVPASEKMEHDRQIQELSFAIRKLVAAKSVWETANVAFSTVKNYIADINEVQAFIENNKGDRVSAADAGKLVDKLITAIGGLEVFKDMRVNLHDFMKTMEPEEREELDKLLVKIDSNIKYASEQLYDENTGMGILQKAGIKIGDAVGIWNLLSMDKEMRFDQKNFLTLSASTFKTAQALYKYVTKARGTYEMKAADMAHEIDVISKKMQEWMGGTWDNKRLLNMIARKDKNGRYKPLLVNKVSEKFYEKLSDSIETKDHKWIKDNIDTKAYKENYEKDLQKVKERAEQTVYDAKSYEENPADRKNTLDQELREKHIQWFIDTFDIDRPTAFTFRNNRLRYYATEANWSEEYKELSKKENAPVKEFYDYIVALNKKAHETGMLGDYYIHFLPQMRKRSLEAAITGDFSVAGRSLLSQFVTEEGEFRYRDPLTNEVVNSLRGKYTYDLGVDNDYSAVSENIMEHITLFAKEVVAFEELSKIEGIAKTLVAIEKEKKSRAYERGKMIIGADGKPTPADNKVNIDYLEKEVDRIMYGEKRQSDPGITINIGGEDLHLSAGKTIDTLVQAFTLKALGLNPQSAFANIFGGASNGYINSGKHFTKTELTKAYHDVLQAKFYTEEGKKFISLLDHFVPFTEEVTRHLGKKASKQEVLDWLSGHGLMVLMRKAENVVQMANASVFFQNTMVENGRLINIRDFVKNKYDYGNLYKKSAEEQKVIKELIEKEVKDLQSTRNLFNDSSIKFDNDTFKVNLRVDRYSDSELDLREQIQQLTRDTLGNRTPDELAQINTFLLGGALMNFKNWIPRLAQKRFGDFKYHAGHGTYEIGRARMLADVMTEHSQGIINKALSFIWGTATKGVGFAHFGTGEQAMIEAARRQYNRRLAEAATIEGTEDSMFAKTVTEAEFIDQYLHGIKAQVKELEAALGMMIAFYGALAFAQSMSPDDDNYAERGAAKWVVRMMDKFSDELGFFYSPTSAGKMIGSGSAPIPLFSTLVDLQKFLTHLSKEGYYIATGDEEAEETNKILKYPISYVPVVNQFSSYFSMFNEDWGKMMGYKPSYSYKPGFQ